jgi:hypothetical protein
MTRSTSFAPDFRRFAGLLPSRFLGPPAKPEWRVRRGNALATRVRLESRAPIGRGYQSSASRSRGVINGDRAGLRLSRYGNRKIRDSGDTPSVFRTRQEPAISPTSECCLVRSTGRAACTSQTRQQNHGPHVVPLGLDQPTMHSQTLAFQEPRGTVQRSFGRLPEPDARPAPVLSDELHTGSL